MPSIIFTNFDGQSLEIDLSKTTNKDALKQGFKHLDKAVYKNKPTNKPKTNVQNKTNRRD
mgnify:CR=1 FL=1|tara:strand:+ start:36 stop:215 length:180 start_codon:yes stop_codon:yes gene_type:complete